MQGTVATWDLGSFTRTHGQMLGLNRNIKLQQIMCCVSVKHLCLGSQTETTMLTGQVLSVQLQNLFFCFYQQDETSCSGVIILGQND